MRMAHEQKYDNENGFTLAALLVALTIMVILWGLAVPVWTKMNQREKELELIWRGEQIEKAIGRYYYKFGSYPPTLEILVDKKFLRKNYTDPIVPDGQWDLLHQTSQQQTKEGLHTVVFGPIIGVTSLSKAQSIVWYQKINQHSKWRFIFYPPGTAPQQQIPGQQGPGRPSQPQQQQQSPSSPRK
jgi:type II secretory pathway pseudopilin PulG